MLEIIKYLQNLKLLYVEDNKETRESTLFLLQDIFKDIVVAIDGQDGLEKFEDHDIDIVITDINMPRLNGLKMAEKIKKIDSNIPIVILSAHMQTEFLIESIKINIKGYLLKPISLNPLLDVLTTVVSVIQVKEEQEKNRKLKEQNHNYLQAVIDGIADPIMVIKEDYNIELMNSTLEESISKLDLVDINNPKCYEVSHHRTTPCDGDNHPCPLRDVVETNKSTTVLHKHHDNNGKELFIELAASPFFDEDKKCVGIIESSRDITAHIDAQKQLQIQKDMLYHQAHYDNLTGLANRVLLNDRLNQAILRAKRNSTKIALFYIDLDKFKSINDTFGHDVGDKVLKAVSEMMLSKMRQEDTLARVGGDEFNIIIENIQDYNDVKALANKVLHSVEEPIYIENKKFEVSASIGVSIYPDDGENISTLLKYSDIAMYKAKKSTENISYYNIK